jgi:hypothetical protein
MRSSRQIVCLLAILLSPFAVAQDVRFAAVDIYLESTEPVAAWQFELADRSGTMKVVGVEQGESPAFERVPYYDREAVRRGAADRIIVADYSLADAGELPAGRSRIATIHLMLSGAKDADFNLQLVTATTYDGETMDARISLAVRTGSKQ